MKKIIIVVALIDMILIALILTMVIRANGEYVTAPEGLRIRAEPSTESEIFEVLPFGSEVNGEIEAGWMRLEGRDGYVCADFVSVDDPHEGMELLGTWRVTAYAETGYPCANGQYPSVGYTVACNSLPFGARIYVEGIGERVVEDRGPSWLGSEWCDLYLGDYWSCVQGGSRNLKVWRMEETE